MKPKTWILIIVIILLIALAFVGYFSIKLIQKNNLPGMLIVPPNSTSFHVDIRDYGFIPENFTIEVGEEIVWKNLGSQNHSIIFPSLNINSKTLVTGANYSLIFNSTGNFSYGCGLHPDKKGLILVK